MDTQPTVTFRGIRPSAALEADVLGRLDKLETYCHSIVGCRVLVELEERRHDAGNRFHVRIALAVPGEEIVVGHDADLHKTAQNLGVANTTKAAEIGRERRHAQVAIREAFEIARRRLQDFARRQRGAVKTHESQA